MIRRVVRRGNPTPIRSAVALLLGGAGSSSHATTAFSLSNHVTTPLCQQQQMRFSSSPASSSSSPAPSSSFAIPTGLTNTGVNEPVEVLDVVLQTVFERYGIPTNANDMRSGSVAAYRALGVVLNQYVVLLEKEGPSTPLPAPNMNVVLENMMTGRNLDGTDRTDIDKANFAPGRDGFLDPAAEAAQRNRELVLRQASYTSLISYVVRSLFGKNAAPLETRSIAEAIEQQAVENFQKRTDEFMLDGHSSSSSSPKTEEGDAKKDSTNAAAASSAAAAEEKDESSSSKTTDENNKATSTKPSSSHSSSKNKNTTKVIDSMNKGVSSSRHAIVERHFPMTNTMRNLLSNFFAMPTHKMVPIIDPSTLKRRSAQPVQQFKEFFTGTEKIYLALGAFGGLFPGRIPPEPLPYEALNASKSPLSISKYLCSTAEFANVYQIAHPADHITRAQISAIRVDGVTIEASEGAGQNGGKVVRTPLGANDPLVGSVCPSSNAMIVDDAFFSAIGTAVSSSLEILDKRRPSSKEAATAHKKIDGKEGEEASADVSVGDVAKELEAAIMGTAAKSGSGAIGTDESAPTRWIATPESAKHRKLSLESFPHICIDLDLDVVVPPRRYVPEFDFFEERMQGNTTEGERLAVAKLIAIHSAISVTRFVDLVYRMFTGNPFKVYAVSNPTIEALAARTGMADVIGPNAQSQIVGPNGKMVEKYPYVKKTITMVYSHHDKEWAIDDIVTHPDGQLK